MPLTADEFKSACEEACPWCKAGNAPRFRDDTNEHVHDYVSTGRGTTFSHTFCLASGIRKAYDSGAIGGKSG